MTQDQRAAIEILLDAKNVLDTDTQLMPLIRFVLFGTTGTVASETDKSIEPIAHEPFVKVRLTDEGRVEACCSKCGNVFIEGEYGLSEFVEEQAKKAEVCPYCYAKFK